MSAAAKVSWTPENSQTRPHHPLLQAERLEAVGRLAGGVAHDFNNLLTGILLYCDLLTASIEPDHRARKYAEEIRKAGVQASGLVRQLLSIARDAEVSPGEQVGHGAHQSQRPVLR